MSAEIKTNESAPMISIKNISKSFGTNAVLKGISLEVSKGKVVALIGGNGAGKSTLMKILMGIHTPDKGDIYIEGKKTVLNRPAAALAQGIYLVPQEPMLVILDEPTRGIDAGARSEVYSIINQLKKKGVAVLLISSDLEEVVELSDRAVTMFQGKINRLFNKAEINLDNLMAASFGVSEEEKAV